MRDRRPDASMRIGLSGRLGSGEVILQIMCVMWSRPALYITISMNFVVVGFFRQFTGHTPIAPAGYTLYYGSYLLSDTILYNLPIANHIIYKA
ncbi:hypothetical protein EXIGLDRAFT_456157 [Exidia glandulosa HHB12029]|uniref:Uncharacterized protein n=1 Tax=Exidia glandulosa HHB12029 TaxID=1314781 RepID=A0A165PME6_EXIGL|nr:hypothetical protein EXIGLDRAFT_456157 [Exidia glandulosa HHB12029]